MTPEVALGSFPLVAGTGFEPDPGYEPSELLSCSTRASVNARLPNTHEARQIAAPEYDRPDQRSSGM